MWKKSIQIPIFLIGFGILAGCGKPDIAGTVPREDIHVIGTELAFISEKAAEASGEQMTRLWGTVALQEDASQEDASQEADEPQEPDVNEYVRVLDYIPDIIVDLKYATEDNFTGQVIYDFEDAYLRYGTVVKLKAAQEQLKEQGYRIKIWDAYRPFYAQERLWEAYPDSRYVADPAKGMTAHNLGNTIDITIVNSDGSEVEMPTGFDDFSTRADRDYSEIDEEAAAHAILLQEVMYQNGFTGYSGEWWDFSDTVTYTEADDFVPGNY